MTLIDALIIVLCMFFFAETFKSTFEAMMSWNLLSMK